MIACRKMADGELAIVADDGKREVLVMLAKNGGSPMYAVAAIDPSGRPYWSPLQDNEGTMKDVVVETIIRAFAKGQPGMVPHAPAPSP